MSIADARLDLINELREELQKADAEIKRLREALEKTREEREYWRGKATGFGLSVSVSSTD